MKLFVTDYDETLFVNEKNIKRTVKKLKKLREKDYKIVIATGRSYPSIHNQTIIYNIPYDYLCCADGSVIYDNNGNILNKNPMDNSIIEPFQNFYQKLNYEEIQFVYKEGYSNVLNKDSELLGINICLSTVNYSKEIVDEFMKMSKLYPDFNFLNYRHPNFSYLCIKPKGITKSSAIKFLKDKLEIPMENIHVIGDSYNDYEMIHDYHGYAIDKACKEVLDIARKKYHVIDELINELLKED